MRWMFRNGQEVGVEFAEHELIIINNALNEILNGIDGFEFSTRIGAERGQVVSLLSEVADALDRRANDGD